MFQFLRAGLLAWLMTVVVVSASAQAQFELVPYLPSISFVKPVDIISFPGSANKLLIAEQDGGLQEISGSGETAVKRSIGDIRSLLSLSGGEQGLLSVAFHPRFSVNRFLFVLYTRASDGASVLSRFKLNSQGELVLSSERRLLVVAQPFGNHNGGKVLFGKDGYLYLSLGDGGGAGDPLNNAQNLRKLLGKILRIDVDRGSNGKRYSIPRSNPFARRSSARPEIFAYGFRNVWRMSFDRVTGRLWAGDVGQNAREEINLVRSGGNYGWRLKEGNACFQPTTNCARPGLIAPLFEYDHSVGSSVTGGVVYRGTQIPSLSGRYLYGDFITGSLYALRRVNRSYESLLLVDTERFISTIGTTSTGELLVADYGGAILKLVAQ